MENVKEHPILFSGEMVRAILDGRKTVTRRMINPQPIFNVRHALWRFPTRKKNHFIDAFDPLSQCPYGDFESADRLWVRETWRKGTWDSVPYLYRADCDQITSENMPGWKPSIHMPRKACRLTLEILNVKVERLNDISEADALAEGIQRYGEEPTAKYGVEYPLMLTAKNAFAWLWESINGRDSWEKNPWVWVIEFRRVQQ